MKEYISILQHGNALTREQVRGACAWLVDAASSLDERADFLRALHDKGESPEEIAFFADALKGMAVPFPPDKHISSVPRIDVCGTGGDGKGFFNVSTSAMFVAAACGARVVKHGNRGITSKCGSADVLEALGVPIHQSPEQGAISLEQAGATFLFAQDYFSTFKGVAPVRKMLADEGIRTIFNIVGPLINPAHPEVQLVGVFSAELLEIYAESLIHLGRKRAWVVCSLAGEDELSIIAPTQVIEITNGVSRRFLLDPQDLGFKPCEESILVGGDATRNAAIIEGILQGEITGGRRDAVTLNAAAALVISGVESDLKQGIQSAEAALQDGRAMKVLERMRSV
ncbi:MAG: anthranilate phosphoribosyltransferase [Chthoniobacterales bacterium]